MGCNNYYKGYYKNRGQQQDWNHHEGNRESNYENKHQHESKDCCYNDNCVADVVKSIVKAQHKAVEAEEDTCPTGCERSIKDLLSPAEENRGPRHNTIPFILYCQGSCKPFIGSGVSRSRRHFECVESPIFRAKNFVDRKENCVRLELLLPVQEENHGHHGNDGHGNHGNHGYNDYDRHYGKENHTVCDFFDGKWVCDFQATGICITVNLDSFNAITCLEPITPLT